MRKRASFLVATICIVMLSACSNELSQVNSSLEQFAVDDSWQIFAFSDFHVDGWQKLCVFGPYLGKEKQKEVLGFDAALIPNEDDSKMWLVFIANDAVVGHVSHPRNQGDLVRVENQCFLREDGNFTKERGTDRRVYLQHFRNA